MIRLIFRDMICANMDRGMSVDDLSKYIKELFKLIPTQELTLKWLDDEGKIRMLRDVIR